MKTCAFEGCDKPVLARGFCAAHYRQQRLKQKLRPLYQTYRQSGTPPNIEFDESPCPNPLLEGPCHIFKWSKTTYGYGQVRADGSPCAVHRYVWERSHGPIPKGLEIDHQCRVRACCNVKHLRLVTKRINLIENSNGMAARNAAKTRCANGHAFDKANTFINNKGHRVCLICRRAKCRRAKRKARA